MTTKLRFPGYQIQPDSQPPGDTTGWRATAELRWFVEREAVGYPRLQQKYVSDDHVEWRDVPVVAEDN